MTECALRTIGEIGIDGGVSPPDLERLDRAWRCLSAVRRVECALDHLPGRHVLSSSFGMQAAVMLHLVTQVEPRIPVIFVDTGYHFDETYRFVDSLCDRLDLNLHVARAEISPAWQEVRHGRRWERGREALESYNRQTKVEPMQRALEVLDAGTWFSGLRRSQAGTRAGIGFVTRQWRRVKVHPIADWDDREVHRYLTRHRLPYHPLRAQGYLSIGDRHSTRSIHEVDDEEKLRFFGLMRECGLHEAG
ncbi:MAG: phosphoadenylyl-sulfate reductase [Xanthomonadales bacterium]|nr:phosphoadenylyl-sulfate reductase [Xanthomonadales bacterium]